MSRSRKPWAPNRVHQVELRSVWRRRHGTRDEQAERWRVTGRFRYSTSQGDILSVRIRCGVRTLNLSEARLRNLYDEVSDRA